MPSSKFFPGWRENFAKKCGTQQQTVAEAAGQGKQHPGSAPREACLATWKRPIRRYKNNRVRRLETAGQCGERNHQSHNEEKNEFEMMNVCCGHEEFLVLK
jgi:hypothetical protein